MTGASHRCRTRGARTPKGLNARLVEGGDTRLGERGQGRECARAPGRRCRLTAGGAPSRSAVRPLHFPFPPPRVRGLAARARTHPAGRMAATGAPSPPPEQNPFIATPRPPATEAKTPTARRPSRVILGRHG